MSFKEMGVDDGHAPDHDILETPASDEKIPIPASEGGLKISDEKSQETPTECPPLRTVLLIILAIHLAMFLVALVRTYLYAL